MSDLADTLRHHLEQPDAHSGLRVGPVQQALNEVRSKYDDKGQPLTPDRQVEAVPLVQALAEGPGPDTLRANATRLLAQLLLDTRPLPTSMEVLVSPGYQQGTRERDEAQRQEHIARGRAILLKLAHDPSPVVAAAAVIGILGNAEEAELPALQKELGPMAPALAAQAGIDRDAALALLRLCGGRQAARWLELLASGQGAPLDAVVLADAVSKNPVPEAGEPLLQLLLKDPAMLPGFEPKAGKSALLAGVPVEDPRAGRARALFAALAAADAARAEEALTHASPSMQALLRQDLAALHKPTAAA